ncbi:hypothetical protein HCN44_005782 [Aphidius gifuensis]|uniref:SET and MYND domain-containing protein 4 n=1 Tax=Aphidius gifuensis TaxID=684658 RepID=A0A834XY62_APHGI|nr:hypothetical protein HCN44_005782 [Aphidius gifuensis]
MESSASNIEIQENIYDVPLIIEVPRQTSSDDESSIVDNVRSIITRKNSIELIKAARKKLKPINKKSAINKSSIDVKNKPPLSNTKPLKSILKKTTAKINNNQEEEFKNYDSLLLDNELRRLVAFKNPELPFKKDINFDIIKRSIKNIKEFYKDTQDVLDNDMNGKCISKSIKYLNSGYKYLNSDKPNYEKSIDKLTISIVNSIPNSTELGLAYGARSIALYNLRLLSDSLNDIERALKNNFPLYKKTELFYHKAIVLKDYYKSNNKYIFDVLEEAKHCAKYMKDINQQNKLLHKINIIQTTSTYNEMIFYKIDYKYYKPDFNNKQNDIPALSTLVKLKYTKKYGRHVVATCDIEPGQLLACDKPYALVVHPDKIYKLCWYCGKQTWSGIPCDDCNQVIYCSSVCRKTAWNDYHEIECKIIFPMRILNLHENLFMAARLTIKAYKEITAEYLQQKIHEYDQVEDPAKRGFTNDKFLSTNYKSIYSLLRRKKNLDKLLLGYHHGYCIMIAYLIITRTSLIGYQEKSSLDELSNNDDFIFLVKLININLEISRLNSMMIDDNSNKLFRIIISSFSFFNHSCDTMTCQRYHGDEMSLTNLYPIKKDQQVFINYGVYYDVMNLNERKNYLKKHYNFNCKCYVCKNNWPTTLLYIKNDEVVRYNRELIKEKFISCYNRYQDALEALDNYRYHGYLIDLWSTYKDVIFIIKVLSYILYPNSAELFDAIQLLNGILCITSQRFIQLAPGNKLDIDIKKNLVTNFYEI